MNLIDMFTTVRKKKKNRSTYVHCEVLCTFSRKMHIFTSHFASEILRIYVSQENNTEKRKEVEVDDSSFYFCSIGIWHLAFGIALQIYVTYTVGTSV